MENRWGVENIRQWSNLAPGTTATDDARITLSLAYAAAQIDSLFRAGGFVVPLVGTGSIEIVKLREWSVVLAGKWIYSSRGSEDDNSFGDKLSDDFDATMEDIALHRSGAMVFIATRADAVKSFIPIAIDDDEAL
jgi:hypothetical protein